MALPALYSAWTWQGNKDPAHLVLKQLAMPALEPGQVLVRNAVVGLNPVDWKVLGGDMGWQSGHVPGVDGAGTIVAIGTCVAVEWLGKRVAYHQRLQGHGSFSQYTPLAASVLMRLPDEIDFAVAASFPCPALTAWQAMQKLPLHAVETLLISGAGGAVGHYLVQQVVARGIRVSAMCNPRHWRRLRDIGVVECIAGPLDNDQAWRDTARFDAVIDSVSALHAANLAPALRSNGHLVCIQGRVNGWPNLPFGRALSLHEVALGALHQHGDAAAWVQLVAAGEQILREIASGQLQPEPAVVGDFTDLPVHLAALKNRHFFGKSLIRIE